MSPDGVFGHQHDIGGSLQSSPPYLGTFGRAAGPALVLGFLVCLVAARQGRALRAEQSFFLFVVFCLLANPPIRTKVLVACFPSLVLLVDSSRKQHSTARLLLVQMFLMKQVVGEQNSLVWLVATRFCVMQNGWLDSPVLS